jgi:hypothetical protein
VHDDLVEEAGLETLPRDVRSQDDHVAAVSRLLGDPDRLLDRNVEEPASGDDFAARAGSWNT